MISRILKYRKLCSEIIRENYIFQSFRYRVKHVRYLLLLCLKPSYKEIIRKIKSLKYSKLSLLNIANKHATMEFAMLGKRDKETHFLHVVKKDHYNDIVNKKRCYTQFYDNLAKIAPDKAQYFTRFIAIEKTTPKHYVLITKYIESTSLYIFLLNKQNIASKEVEANLIEQISTYCTVFNESKIMWSDASFCNMLVAQDGDDIILMPIDFQHDENDLSADDIKQHNKNMTDHLIKNIKLAFMNKEYKYR